MLQVKKEKERKAKICTLSASQFMQNKLGISLSHCAVSQTAHRNWYTSSPYTFNANLIFHIMQNILVGHRNALKWLAPE